MLADFDEGWVLYEEWRQQHVRPTRAVGINERLYAAC
jgi:hypothetical protein